MKFSNISIVSLAFILLLLCLVNPFGFWMPTELEYITVAALAVVSAVFAGLILGEKARDEREEALRAHAARAGYLTGVFMLTLSIAVTVLTGAHVDMWIPLTLAAMVIVRAFVRSKAE